MFWEYHATIAKICDYIISSENLTFFLNKKIAYDYFKTNVYLKKNCDYIFYEGHARTKQRLNCYLKLIPSLSFYTKYCNFL